MASVSNAWVDGEDGDMRAARLATAYEELAEVLESVDLEDEPELADAVIEAVDATDEAYRTVTWEDGPASLE